MYNWDVPSQTWYLIKSRQKHQKASENKWPSSQYVNTPNPNVSLLKMLNFQLRLKIQWHLPSLFKW